MTSGAKRRVAITGLGLVTSAGNNAATTWSTLLEGRSRIATITRFDASGFPVRIAAEVRGFDDVAAVGDRKQLKFAGRSHRFALAAADEAMRDAGIHIHRHRTGTGRCEGKRIGCSRYRGKVRN